jgi:tRNA(Phe) wybutosine-synthesizing methylase Tyw3
VVAPAVVENNSNSRSSSSSNVSSSSNSGRIRILEAGKGNDKKEVDQNSMNMEKTD